VNVVFRQIGYFKTTDEIQSFGISLCVVNLQAGIEVSCFCGIHWEAPFVNWSESGQSEGHTIYIIGFNCTVVVKQCSKNKEKKIKQTIIK
jgi:hypothetical protein